MSYTYKENTDQFLQMDIKFTDNSKEVLEAIEVYNCRCTPIAAVEGVDTSNGLRRDRYGILPDMTFAQWQNSKRGEGYLQK